MFEAVNHGRLRVHDDRGNRMTIKRSALRKGWLALVTRPNQQVIFLDTLDAIALRDFLNAYLEETP